MNKILFIDLLTTGNNPQKCGIYAMGGSICADTQSQTREIKRFEYRIRPFDDARISDNSLWLGGMTRSQLLYFRKENEVLESFIGILSEAVKLTDPTDKLFICGFNTTAFDMPFLKEFFDRNGNKNFRNFFHMQSIDLMTLSAYALMNERTSMTDFNLETVARKTGIITRLSEKYSCSDNVETCISLYRKLKENLGRGEWGSFVKCENTETNF